MTTPLGLAESAAAGGFPLAQRFMARWQTVLAECTPAQYIDEAWWSFQHVASKAPDHVLEVGTKHGGWVALMSAARPGMRFTCLDRAGSKSRHAAQRLIEADGGTVTWLTGDSHAADVVAKVREAVGGTVDGLHVDGDHEQIGCMADLTHYAPLVRPGGLILLHDPHNPMYPGPGRAWQHVMARGMRPLRYAGSFTEFPERGAGVAAAVVGDTPVTVDPLPAVPVESAPRGRSPFRARPTEALLGTRSARTAFLLLPGPSLACVGLERLRQPGLVTMGINRSVYLYARPTYYVMCDKWTTYPDSLWLDPAVTKFVRCRTPGLIDRWPAVINTSWGRKMPPAAFFDGPQVPESIAEGGLEASTMVAALSILARLGYRRVCLVGADFRMDPANPYCVPMTRTDAESRATDRMFRDIETTFTLLGPIWAEHGFEVVNCTPGSVLQTPAVGAVSFDSAVDQALREVPDRSEEWPANAADSEQWRAAWPPVERADHGTVRPRS